MTPRISCGDVVVTREDLSHRAAQVASGLVQMGIGRGDRIVLLLRNCLEFLEISLGAGRLGAYVVPINWHFTRNEVDALLEDCDPSAIILHRGVADRLSANQVDRIPTLAVDDGEQLGPSHIGFDEYAAWRDKQTPLTAPSLPAPGAIVYTSGTTGRPKGVVRGAASPDDAARMSAVRRRIYRLDPSSRLVIPGPLYHAFPCQLALYGIQEAEQVHVCPRFDPEGLLALIEQHRITTLGVAPIIFVRLLRLPQSVRERYDVSSLQWVLHAGGPCASNVKQAMIDWWGPIIGEFYGGTETGPLTLGDSHDWLRHPGTCGRPLPEATVRIVNAQGSEAKVGEAGEIYARLWPYPDFTYRNDPQKRADVGMGELVSLGDVGYFDEDGYVYLCDRARDMIVSGAVNIYPAEVEAALFGIEGVEDCAVFGVPDEEFGELPVAMVCGTGLDEDTLKARLRQAIAGYKIPRRLLMVGSLDRDPSGKLRKKVLKDRYLALLADSEVKG